MDVVLDGRGRRRQGQIDRDLPDFLDVLSVCVSAGIAFRPAMGRVAEAIGGPVAEEVQTALRQIALGAPRREAFQALRERNTSEALGTFVSAFLQAEELGVPLADALVDLARRHAPRRGSARPPPGAERGAARVAGRHRHHRAGGDPADPRLAADQRRPRGPGLMDVTRPPLAPLCRLVLLFRLIAVNMTVFQALGAVDRAPKVLAGLLVASLASYLPLKYWDRVGPVVAARPMLLGADLAISLAIYAFLGPESPFFLYTLGTGLLGGILFREIGAAVFSLALLGGYYALVVTGSEALTNSSTSDPASLQTLVTLPVLYPLMAAGGAAVRNLIDRQSATELRCARPRARPPPGRARARGARDARLPWQDALRHCAERPRAGSPRGD